MKKNIKYQIIYTLGILFLLTACATKTPRYVGYYFDATINDKKIVKVEDRSVLKNLERYYAASDVHWMVKEKLSGGIDITVNNNAISSKFIGTVGDDEDLDIYVIPLGNQELNSTKEITQSKDVFVGGAPVTKTENVMTDNTLPPGAYIIKIKTIGPKNWDRKYVYVEYE